MLKALLKKQLSEALAFFYLNNKDGKRRSTGAVIGFAALMLYAFGAIVVMFWLLSETLCTAFVGMGMDWLYFAFIGVMATAFGVIGSVFAAKTKLYEAKDNELLLSLPVPSWMILFSRMVGLYGITFFFESLILLPAFVRYFTLFGITFLPVLYCVLLLFLLPLCAVALCCLLGWAIALITARLPAKNLFTVLFSFAFLIAYFALYSKLTEGLNFVIENGEAIGAVMKTSLYPFWKMGLAATGDTAAFLLFAGMALLLFAAIYAILSKTYFGIITLKRGELRAKYKEKEARVSSVDAALLKRELLHLIKSPIYLLNASLGTLALLVMGVWGLIKGEFLGFNADMVASSPVAAEFFGLITAALLCLLISTNIFTAPSVSLEGENIWLLQSLPIEPWRVLRAKLTMHLLFTAPPALFCGLVLGFIFGLPAELFVLSLLLGVAFSVLTAVLGLTINLKIPNLRWTSEAAAVKQSMSTMVSMFGNWGIVLLFVGGYFLFGKYLFAWTYLLICLALVALGCVLLTLWLKKRGAHIFETLS